jgi:broad specificity phosphatase PhoE
MMTTLHLVRHGEASAGWGSDADPGLSDLGHQQAAAMAASFTGEPLPIITSPLRRARETAYALEQHWNTAALVEPGVGELPSPTEDLAERRAWLETALAQNWTDLGPRYTSWRTMVVHLLLGLRDDTVVVSHYVLINAVLGAATGSDAVIIQPIANAGVVSVTHDHKTFQVVDMPLDPAAGSGTVL